MNRFLLAVASLASMAGALPPQDPAPVRSGLDVLIAQDFAPLKGRKVGLVTNQTGRARDGRHAVDVFLAQKVFLLKALFSPEHGFEGALDQARIDDAKHGSGLVIHSLYGEVRQPSKAMLDGLDTLVFDVQDAGARFYTYAATMRLCMEAAAEHALEFVVLDRPNPIGGILVQGPVLADGDESFVAPHTIPIRHGMTLGELAHLFDVERALACSLSVIPMDGWQRSMLWEDTGLSWVNPSPNLRTPTQALLYPGVALLEPANVSVGRGTDTPFEVVGAPWLDGQALWSELRGRALPGVAFTPLRFTPSSSKHSQEDCGGVRIAVTDRAALDPLLAGITLIWAIARVAGDDFELDKCSRLLLEPDAPAALQMPTAKIPIGPHPVTSTVVG
ncbi:MAG: DUF1343 domain-containing protein [Planctomycetes bacterium]|nr:DUF1343 domain-containing protein [Planctomycetota bacterium]